jgi:hypothetical protein
MAGWMVRGKMALLLARDRPRGDRLTTGRGHTHRARRMEWRVES